MKTSLNKTSLNIGIFEQGTRLDHAVTETARAGFDAVELVLTTDGPLTFDCERTECARIADHAGRAGLGVSAVVVEEFREVNLGSPDAERRRTARQRTVAALERATWLGCDTVVIVPAVVGEPDSPRPRTTSENAYAEALGALLSLRFEAEQRAVRLACKNSRNKFLLSPLEMRDFVDEVNSCWVGVYLDVADTMPWGYPQDWIRTLTHRLVGVCLGDFRPAGQSCGTGVPPVSLEQIDAPRDREGILGPAMDIDWVEIMAALEEAHYEGPVTCRGPGDAAEVAARLSRVLGDGE